MNPQAAHLESLNAGRPGGSVPSLGSEAQSTIARRRYHLHTPGVTYALTTCVLIFGAINGQNNLLFLIFGLAVGGLLVSGVISGAALMGLRVRREIDVRGEVGGEVELRYIVTNTNRFLPAFAVVIEEQSGSRQSVRSRIGVLWNRLRQRAPAKVQSAEKDGAVWQSMISQPRAVATFVPAGSTVTVRCRVKCLRRGIGELSSFLAATTFPFGLTRKSVSFSQRSVFLVRPKPTAVDAHALGGALGEADRSRSNVARRDGDEFHALREYVPGDPIRSVAWRASARSEGLRVRSATPRTERAVELCVELDGLSAREGEEVRSLAAGVLDLAARSKWRIGLVDADGAAITPMGSTREAVGMALDALAMERLPDAQTGAPRRRAVPITVRGRGAIAAPSSKTSEPALVLVPAEGASGNSGAESGVEVPS